MAANWSNGRCTDVLDNPDAPLTTVAMPGLEQKLASSSSRFFGQMDNRTVRSFRNHYRPQSVFRIYGASPYNLLRVQFRC
jgi:hypothetical protein